jgi:hypothetical protein
VPYVRGHIRNGTWVRGHYRRRPGTTGLGGMALAVVVLGVVGALGAAGGRPAPSTTTPPTEAPRRTAPVLGHPHYIVQVASAVQRSQAESAARELVRRGWRDAGALRSGAYDGLRPGYWVAYVGPFEATSHGRSVAERVQEQLPGSLVRLIRSGQARRP